MKEYVRFSLANELSIFARWKLKTVVYILVANRKKKLNVLLMRKIHKKKLMNGGGYAIVLLSCQNTLNKTYSHGRKK